MSGTNVAVVLNGKAGALLDQSDALETLRAGFEAAGLVPHFIPLDAGTLPQRVALAAATGAGIVVAAGGDGTVACVAQALVGRDAAMGVLPFGTMNLLAKDLGIPVGDTEAAIRVLAEGRARAIDVGEVNGHVFLCGSMLGLPARLARYREERRGSGLSPWHLWRLLLAWLRGFARHAPLRATLRFGARRVRVRTSSITVTAGAIAEGRGFVRERPDSGELAVYVTPYLGAAEAMRLLARLLAGSWQHDPAMTEHRAPTVRISARGSAMRVMNDGEIVLLRPPLRYRVRPQALRVMAP